MAERFRKTNNSAEVVAQLERGVQANLKAAALIWHGSVIRTLSGTRSGRTYSLEGTGRTYTASAPGEPPAVKFGDLRTSYRFQVSQGMAEIGTPLEKAVWLEFGTQHMAPRPHLFPAYTRAEQQIKDALDRNVI